MTQHNTPMDKDVKKFLIIIASIIGVLLALIVSITIWAFATGRLDNTPTKTTVAPATRTYYDTENAERNAAHRSKEWVSKTSTYALNRMSALKEAAVVLEVGLLIHGAPVSDNELIASLAQQLHFWCDSRCGNLDFNRAAGDLWDCASRGYSYSCNKRALRVR